MIVPTALIEESELGRRVRVMKRVALRSKRLLVSTPSWVAPQDDMALLEHARGSFGHGTVVSLLLTLRRIVTGERWLVETGNPLIFVELAGHLFVRVHSAVRAKRVGAFSAERFGIQLLQRWVLRNVFGFAVDGFYAGS